MNELTTDQRAALVTARETIRRAARGEDADLPRAAAYLDMVLRETCPHDPATWSVTEQDGETLTTCPLCGVSWFGPAA
ncbi:MAG: hypothetical protein WBA46_05910 [Thermomicrobiales bacterium]